MQPFFTPLQLSAAIGKVEMVEALLRYGADPRKTVNLSDPESCVSVFHPNALDLARHMKHDDVVAALEKHNVNALNISLYSNHYYHYVECIVSIHHSRTTCPVLHCTRNKVKRKICT